MLLSFSKEGDLKKSKAALTLGANLEATDSAGLTPLCLSLLNGHKKLAEFFIERKANLDAIDQISNQDVKKWALEHQKKVEQAIALQSQIRGFFARKQFQKEKECIKVDTLRLI